MQFYRRQLPEGCIELSSETGKQLFKESLNAGFMECYFKLSSQFRTQDEPAFCGLSSLVMVLNALSVDPGRVWKGPWRWYHESMLDCCAPLQLVVEKGITFDQFICLSECNFLVAKAKRVTDDFEEDEFRQVVRNLTVQDDTMLVVSYSRKVLNQTGDGHFSPVGGYHPDKDLVLVLDTARFKYPPHWIPLRDMVSAMKALDKELGKPRGFIQLSRHKIFGPLLLFRISPLLSVNLSEGLTPEISSFLDKWCMWLSQPTESNHEEKDTITAALGKLFELGSSLKEQGSILTSQVDVKCPELVSKGHLCAAQLMIQSVEQLEVFQITSEVIQQFRKTQPKDVLLRVCKAEGEVDCGTGSPRCCELQKLLSPSHFFSVLLLSWPYGITLNISESNAGILKAFVKSSLANSSDLLAHEVGALRQQFITILSLYNRNKCRCKRSGKTD